MKSKRRWLHERRNDPYFILSKKEGYRSRASFKLKQIIGKYRIIKPGDNVLDIGCAPGGWLQVASQHVGNSGMVLGVDLKPVEDLELENVKTCVLNVFDEDFTNKVMRISGGKFDVVLSDLSPNMSGIYEIDHARQIEMVERVISLLKDLLRKGGCLVIKIFEGQYARRVDRKVFRMFKFVKRVKPKASRKSSSEYYLVARFFKGS
ncbi:MAG: RlmE family RNA methyltransferase [Candidatus Brockarchaeota archaeon]|nr:RlmE family RNA methyltransferase [Candidatus Brockarchaeota archaeon]